MTTVLGRRNFLSTATASLLSPAALPLAYPRSARATDPSHAGVKALVYPGFPGHPRRGKKGFRCLRPLRRGFRNGSGGYGSASPVGVFVEGRSEMGWRPSRSGERPRIHLLGHRVVPRGIARLSLRVTTGTDPGYSNGRRYTLRSFAAPSTTKRPSRARGEARGFPELTRHTDRYGRDTPKSPAGFPWRTGRSSSRRPGFSAVFPALPDNRDGARAPRQ